MDKEYIIDNIERLINTNNYEWKLEEKKNLSSVEAYLYNTTVRLINIHAMYKRKEISKIDYLSALRQFMIAYKTELTINELLPKEAERFAIFFNFSTRKFYATYKVPRYIQHKEFVEICHIDINTEVSQDESPYLLCMNSYLQNLTGYTKYKSIEQKLCVQGALNTPDSYTALICMPTGGGKSLITQALGYEKKGLSIVVVPTVSLAMDQERTAKEKIKIARDNEIFAYYSGSGNINEIKEAIINQTARLLFISPEALIKNNNFKEIIMEANANRFIRNLIIDEAHTVVAWGDFFRVDYQCLGPWRRDLLKVNPSIRTYLMSATFTDDTVKILKNIFCVSNQWLEIRCDSLRKEPRYILINNDNYICKKNRVLELVDLMPKPMILYVNSPFEANKWKNYLEENGYRNNKTFTGNTGDMERKKLIKKWSDNEFEIMIATSAFGVGVDKPDVRCVLHLYVPENPDAYYQELGRGGRDGLPCLSIMCIEKEDVNKAYNHISKVLTTEKLWGRWWSMFKNPNTIWSGKEIVIFTSTKPKYSRTDYFEEGNETDEKWNINVILLLSRYNLINIVAIDLDDENRYIFTINIHNEIIMNDTDEAKMLFNTIREEESNKSIASFNLMRESIMKTGKVCWSSMFYETYPLVSEYCGGCDEHEDIECDELYRFPLLTTVKVPERKLSEEVITRFSDTNEAIIISDERREEIIKKYTPNIIIMDEKQEYDEMSTPQLLYMNFKEYKDLQERDKGFFISGLIMVIYNDNIERAKKEYRIIKEYMIKGSKIIHVVNENFSISNISNRTITADIDGCILN